MSLEFLESVECKGKVIRGKIHNFEVYLLAKDVTDLFGYKNGKNTVNKKVSKENIIKFPIDGVNGNQYNLININGVNELISGEIKLVNEKKKKEIIEVLEGVIDFLQRKNDFLMSERNFVWFESEKEKRKYMEKNKKPFWKRFLGI
jgi:hypothetical protein|nr:MAG TPA: hypothetical protein [Caudoviricetes sp.]